MLIYTILAVLTFTTNAKAGTKGNYAGCYQKNTEASPKFSGISNLEECFEKCQTLYYK